MLGALRPAKLPENFGRNFYSACRPRAGEILHSSRSSRWHVIYVSSKIRHEIFPRFRV